MVRNFGACAAAMALVLFSGAASATTAYEFTSAPISQDAPLSLGFSFTTSSALKVTALGYYDDGGNGLAQSHNVGIFNTLGALVGSATVAAGTAATLDGHFRYVAVTPFTLAAGQTYVAAATTGGSDDPWAYGSIGGSIAGFTANPAISIGANAALYHYQNDDVLRMPSQHYSNYSVYAGPNFQTAAVPEPASWAMMISGFGMVGAMARSRRPKRALAA